MSSSTEVARFMAHKFEENGSLSHREAVTEIRNRFGDQHLYTNENGNLAISKTVLKRFKELTHGEAEWKNRRGRGCWFRRRPRLACDV